ncbi:MAG: hypothetical protein ACQCN3_15490 [Candidatus Bathyarchaeia archaeon]|jgi:hypothetical protein
MDKKRASALTLIVTLSIIVVTPIAFTNMANANFCFPPSNPDITFNSPVNTTYATNDVFLNVTIDTYLTGWFGGPTDESYTRLEYSVDGNNFQPLTIVSSITQGNPGNPAQFNCSISLHQLSNGNHTLMVKAVFDYYEHLNEKLRHTESVANAYLIIDAVPDNMPTSISTSSPKEDIHFSPSELVISAIAIMVLMAVAVSVYYVRIKR